MYYARHLQVRVELQRFWLSSPLRNGCEQNLRFSSSFWRSSYTRRLLKLREINFHKRFMMKGQLPANAITKRSAYSLSTPSGEGSSLFIWALSVSCSDGTNAVVATLFRGTLLRHSGHRFDGIISTIIQDRAAKVNTNSNVIAMFLSRCCWRYFSCCFWCAQGVSAHLGLDEEVCGMHDGDEIG